MEIDDSVTVRVDFAEPGHRVYVTVCFPKRGSGDPQIKAGAAGTNTDTDTGEEGAYSQTQTQGFTLRRRVGMRPHTYHTHSGAWASAHHVGTSRVH